MEPVPETRAVMGDLAAYGDVDLAERLEQAGRRVSSIVPECVGLSVSHLVDGLTFTLVASSAEIATLDATQYLDGGPCVESGLTAEEVAVDDLGALDERQWLLYAGTGAAAGVASSLSLPLRRNGTVTGSVNLYASAPNAFEGHHEELAAIFGAWAPGAVTNGDLGFQTRLEAAAAPERSQDLHLLDQAGGLLAASQGIDVATARRRLRDAAARAGITEVQVARAVLEGQNC
jgi:GAF domain-containing protein